MPSRGSYQISNIEEGKVAQRDQSFRSCVVTLLIFLFLCIILILAALPWKSYNSYRPEQKDQHVETAQHHRHHELERTSTTTSANSKDSKELEFTSEINISSENVDIININSTDWIININNSSVLETFRNEETTPEVLSSTDKQLYASISTGEKYYKTKGIVDESTTGTTDFTELIERYENTTDGNITEIIISTRLNENVVGEHKKDSTDRSTTEAVTKFSQTDTIKYEENTTDKSITEASNYTELKEITTEEYNKIYITDNNSTEVPTSTNQNCINVTDESKNKTNEENITVYASISTREKYYETKGIVDESTTGTTDFTELIERYENTTDGNITEIIISTRLNENVVGEHKKDSTDRSTTEAVTKFSQTDTIKYEEDTTNESITDEPNNKTNEENITVTESVNENLQEKTTKSSMNDEPNNKMNEESITTTKSMNEYLQKTTTESSLVNELTDNMISDLLNNEVCDTGECKNHASKMLFYMNHTIDPCEDFYEYACGGFEANPRTVEQNLEDVAHQRILRQMQKEEENKKNLKGKSRPSLFAQYYQSCIHYEQINRTERIQMVREVLDGIGKFYTNSSEFFENHTSFTELIAKLLSYNSALLFDVAPDLDEYQPKLFTIRIGPTIHGSPFNTDPSDDPCYDASKFEMESKTVYLQDLYAHYKTCKNNTSRFMSSVAEALTALGIFDNIQQRQLTINVIDIVIMKKFVEALPTRDKIREAYLMKNYTLHSIKELERDFKPVNWTHLIHYTTNYTINPDAKVQVYFYEVLAEGLKNLKEDKAIGPHYPMLLYNALLGLYAHDLYHQFVLSKYRDIRKYCLRITANVLIAEASNLYISSFSEDRLAYMNSTIHDLFEDLRTSLKQKIESVEWVTEKQRDALITKINDLKVVTPNVSYLTDTESTYRKYNATEVNLKNNYFENSIILMQRYRKLMYAEFSLNPGSPEHVWTHYATPYQSKGLAIYGLNLVIIPFGAIDWSIEYNEPQFDYIKLATLGNVIAHQIAHHFDANGIYYWNGTRDANNTLLNNDSTNTIFDDYINVQRNYLYSDSMNSTLASTGQTIVYEIPQLTLNERLSEIMGVRLAYDTLDRLRSPKEIVLPWLQLNVNQLFYLTYAQMHCTKSPLTSSYISLYESEQLPSPIRIFVTASNIRLIGKAWNCSEGSRIMPSYFCNAFPYLPCTD
ncbi:endothelin-converting enzyme homolog [Ceratina calcarata]|uniref:Endothelin-converting enzyme homolog n=1 Tax=Ceratina calcarata TaxID=156304 RepID=A0AAJ7N5G5_9HYME|nr:endothelin-converting enzyme homolog [Ceratina calcarata]